MSSTIRSLPATISGKSPRERVSTPLTAGRIPVVASTAPPRCSISWCSAPPTVPWPSSPTLKMVDSRTEESTIYVTRRQVLVGLAAHDHPCLAVAAEDDGRAGHAVVVVRHRVAVRAGAGRDEH